MAENSDGLSPAGAAARRLDRERFLAALAVPPTQRDAVFALIAFNGELARAREAATDPTLGLIRLQWWRDLVDGLRADDPASLGKHEIGPALAAALRTAPVALIDGMIDARDADFEPEPPADDAAFLAYVDATAGALARLCVHAAQAGDGCDDTSDQIAGLVGRAYGVIGLIRALPFRLRRGRLDLPESRLTAAGVTLAALQAGDGGPGLRTVCRALVEEAEAGLKTARAARAPLTPAARNALLIGVWADDGAKKLRAAGFDPFHPASLAPTPFAALRLAWASWRGRF